MPTYAVLARIPAAGVTMFDSYETQVLGLLDRYGGRLERRLATEDGTTEIHLLHFPSTTALGAFRSDPERRALTSLLERSEAAIEMWEVHDCGDGISNAGGPQQSPPAGG